jgi:hypothetical protein
MLVLAYLPLVWVNVPLPLAAFFDEDGVGNAEESISKALYRATTPFDMSFAFTREMLPMESHVANMGFPLLCKLLCLSLGEEWVDTMPIGLIGWCVYHPLFVP